MNDDRELPFRRASKKIESRVIIQKEVLWIPRLGSNYIWALNGVSTEEDGLWGVSWSTCLPSLGGNTYPIQAHDVIVSLGSVEFDSEAPGIACRIGELATKSDGGEADENGSLLAGALEEVGLAALWETEDQLLISSTVNLCLPDVTHVFGALEIAKGAGAARMDHA